jgi:hypothetical protein
VDCKPFICVLLRHDSTGSCATLLDAQDGFWLTPGGCGGGIDNISWASEYLLRFEYGFVAITNLECFFASMTISESIVIAMIYYLHLCVLDRHDLLIAFKWIANLMIDCMMSFLEQAIRFLQAMENCAVVLATT